MIDTTEGDHHSEANHPLGVTDLPADHPWMLKLPANTFNPNLSQALRSIYSLFVDVALVPLPFEDPRVPLFEDTQKDVYVKRLKGATRLGVYVGKQCGICVLQLSKGKAEKFLNDNPYLERTLVTTTADQFYVWFRYPDAEIPPSIWTQDATWMASDCVVEIAGVRSTGTSETHQIVQVGHPVTLDIRHTDWGFAPEISETFRFSRIIDRHGPSAIAKQNGRLDLNAHFWAAFLAEYLGVRCGADEKTFKASREDGADVGVSEGTVQQWLARLILALGRLPHCAQLLEFRTERRLREIVSAVRIVSPPRGQEAVGSVQQFLKEYVLCEPGKAVTSSELYCAYRESCEVTGVEAERERVFYRRLTPAMHGLFGAVRSSSIRRNGVEKSGFRGVRLKHEERTGA